MATVACAGCGLPRVESELGATPCPVCDAAPLAPSPRAKAAPSAPDPTAGMPADVSQLYTAPPPAGTASGSRVTFGAVAFLCGALCGVGGVFAVQAIEWPKGEAPEVAAVATEEPPAPAAPPSERSRPPLRVPEVAPMPHEPTAKPIAGEPEPEPAEVKQIKAPLPGHVETHEFNEPKDVYSVPPLKKGEHVVLKGKEKVKALRVHGLDAGAVLDASGLDAAVITISGKIDGGAKLILNAPGGTVHISSKIDGRSEVTIAASGGEVKFTAQTTARNDGSKIDGGAKVSITARVVEFKGDVGGAGTKVSVLLTRNAWLKFASVSGGATLEYKSQVAGWSPPDVIVGTVGPGATFQKIE